MGDEVVAFARVETSAFDYDLPPAAIAQTPVEPRDAARLLVVDATEPDARHRTVADVPGLLRKGDVLVVNETRVRRARLHLRKSTGGAAEVLLLERRDDATWEALVRPGRRLPAGTVLLDDGGEPIAQVGAVLDEEGVRSVRLLGCDGLAEEEALIERMGQTPLPPYVTGALDDDERYQTTFAARVGSVAAPTAGLHLTPALLERCEAAGARVERLDLHVGLGTFKPVSTPTIETHQMHREAFAVPAATWEACQAARQAGGRVVAIGTTVVRALETAAATGERSGISQLFLRPGSPFAVVDALLTNFHLPRSTLLVLLEAFMGPSWRTVYGEALREGYRFLSFGDAMFVERRQGERA